VNDLMVGVYVHIPFCERVCPYCDFAVIATPELTANQETRYVNALLRELASRSSAYRDPSGLGRRLASIYLGGGTPSLLTPESLNRIIGAIRVAFSVNGSVEMTLEVNPSTLELSRLSEFRALGVNRLSVGVQSFDDATLKRLGRGHRAEEADLALVACRAAGFEAISLDLIFAAPGQRLADLEADLERVLAFGPDHVSTYELTIESGTPFALAASRGQLSLPDEGEAIAMMETIEARLGAGGFERYEISNYARPGFRAVHNRRYWERQPVLGIGIGAVSTEPPSAAAPFGSRRSNVRDLRTYLDGPAHLPRPDRPAAPDRGGPHRSLRCRYRARRGRLSRATRVAGPAGRGIRARVPAAAAGVFRGRDRSADRSRAARRGGRRRPAAQRAGPAARGLGLCRIRLTAAFSAGAESSVPGSHRPMIGLDCFLFGAHGTRRGLCNQLD
jgi:oxygen-independent coproporphyrinogen-3 oxidase